MLRRWPALLLSICVTVAGASSCMSATGGTVGSAAQLSTSSASSAPDSATSNAAICGLPPCDKYLSRSRTRSLDDALSGHPIVSAVALHLVVGLVCGVVLCIVGEGFTFIYAQREAHQAAKNGECLRVHILPQGRAWQLVRLDATNQSPYCTD